MGLKNGAEGRGDARELWGWSEPRFALVPAGSKSFSLIFFCGSEFPT